MSTRVHDLKPKRMLQLKQERPECVFRIFSQCLYLSTSPSSFSQSLIIHFLPAVSLFVCQTLGSLHKRRDVPQLLFYLYTRNCSCLLKILLRKRRVDGIQNKMFASGLFAITFVTTKTTVLIVSKNRTSCHLIIQVSPSNLWLIRPGFGQHHLKQSDQYYFSSSPIETAKETRALSA